ncbi:hypothetical protein T265_13245, partial [Opisthorchis viverrini]
AKWPKWLEREFTERKARGSNPTSVTRLPLSRLRRPGSILALALPPGGMAARHRKTRLVFTPQSTEICFLSNSWYTFIIIIIIIDSMTPMFNTDALLSYNHDLFESLIVKKRVKVDGEGLSASLPQSFRGAYTSTHSLRRSG